MGNLRLRTLAALGALAVAVAVIGSLSGPSRTPSGSAVAAEPGWIGRQIAFLKSMVTSGSDRGQVRVAPGAATGGAVSPPVVTASKPVSRRVVEWDEYTGRFDAVDAVEIRARVSGYLTKVHFKDGQMVRQGDPLFSIDSRTYERALDQAKAELEQSKVKVESAAKDVDRGRPLVDRRIISEKVQDDRENQKREAEAAVKVNEAKVKLAELDLSFTSIAAPISGRISRASVNEGNWVNAGTASNPTLLTSIVSQDPIHIYFDVSENNLIKYKRLGNAGSASDGGSIGGPVEIALSDETGFPHKGQLDFSDNRLDPGTSTLRARAVVANAQGLFSPGMFARVRITGSAPYTALMLPDEAIGTDQTIKFVFAVADDGTVTRKPVTLGPQIGGLRVIRSGIAESDWIIIKGVQRARPGQKVAPKREPIQLTAAGELAASAGIKKQ